MVRSWPDGKKQGEPVKRQAKEQYASEGISDYFGFPTFYPFVLARLKEKNVIVAALSSKVVTDFSFLDAETRWKLTQGLETSKLAVPVTAGKSEFNTPGSDSIWYQLDDDGVWFARGGRTILPSGFNEYWVGLWGKNQSRPYRVYRGKHKWTVEIVTVSRDGKRVASADKFGQIHVWDAKSANPIRVFDSAKHARIWNVKWNRDGSGVHYATKNLVGTSYKPNVYGKCNQFFHLSRRYISDAKISDNNTPINPTGANEETLTVTSNGKQVNFSDPAFGVASSLEPLEGNLDNLENLVAVGSESGKIIVLEVLDGNRYRIRRWFHGHHAKVTGLSQSPDGKMLASSSIDGTIRFWSLENMSSYSGDIDFKFRGNQVISFGSNSETARVGIGETDTILLFGNTSFYESRKHQIAGAYKPGQTIRLTLARAHTNVGYDVDYQLQRSATHVEPIASLLITKTGANAGDNPEWVIWSPRGYYDASNNGDRLIGWHVNNSREENADFYKASQFSKELYRPNVIDQIFDTLDTDLAIETYGDVAVAIEADHRQGSRLTDIAPPTVKIKSPSVEGKKVGSKKQKVLVSVNSNSKAEITRLDIRVNGLEAGTKELKKRSSRLYEQRVELQPGKNIISAVAYTNKSESIPATVTVHYVPKIKITSDKGNLHVIAIGISDYQDDAIPDLDFAAKDATEFAAVCEAQEGTLYDEVSVQLLTDEEATRANILNAFSEVVKQKPTQKDCVMILYSGHGFFDDGQYFFSTNDTIKEMMLSSAIGQETVEKLASRSLARCRRLLFIDACHSGATMSSGITGDPWHNSGSVVFASANWRETSYEVSELENGALVQALLEATLVPSSGEDPARNAVEDDFVNASELQSYFMKRIPQITDEKQRGSTAWDSALIDFPAFKRVKESGD